MQKFNKNAMVAFCIQVQLGLTREKHLVHKETGKMLKTCLYFKYNIWFLQLLSAALNSIFEAINQISSISFLLSKININWSLSHSYFPIFYTILLTVFLWSPLLIEKSSHFNGQYIHSLPALLIKWLFNKPHTKRYCMW